MKKLVCTLLALIMLCSLMVVNVSAANTYEGEGFRIVTEYELDGMLTDGGEPEYGWAYEYYYNDDMGYIAICVFSREPGMSSEVNEDNVLASDNTFQGLPAIITENIYEDHSTYIIETFTENYCYELRASAMDDNSYAIGKDIINNIELSDLTYDEPATENIPTKDDCETSTYWENEYFTIDTDVELTCTETVFVGETYYDFELIDGGISVGTMEVQICTGLDFDEDLDELVSETSDFYEKEGIETTINGISVLQWEEYNCREIITTEGEYIYVITINGIDDGAFSDLCQTIENDFSFANIPEEDEKSEDKNDKTDKEDKGDDEKDNSTVIIVAIVCGTVLILGVTAIIVFGKKKKQ